MAGAYAARSLRVFPTGGPNGKKPLIRNWPRVGLRAARELADKFPNANIGVIDGHRGGVTRIDIDDPALMDGAIRRFGDTAVKVATPSGGLHLWYRANGERRAIRLEGEKIDVLGWGGFGVAPPSVNPRKGAYRFEKGGLDDLDRLEPIRPGSLPPEVYRRSRSKGNDGRSHVEGTTATYDALRKSQDGKVGEGHREEFLFKEARRLAPSCASLDEFLLNLRTVNETRCDPPLSDREVVDKARHVWRLKELGRCYPPGAGQSYVHVTGHEIDSLNSDALYLLASLRRWHWGLHEEFVLANAMAEALNWTLPRFKAVIGELFKKGILVQTHAGGRGPGDPRRARFGPASNKGSEIAHQYNYTPLPSHYLP